jgi:hypothetical protein
MLEMIQGGAGRGDPRQYEVTPERKGRCATRTRDRVARVADRREADAPSLVSLRSGARSALCDTRPRCKFPRYTPFPHSFTALRILSDT